MNIENLIFMIAGGILGFIGSVGFYYLQRCQKRKDFKKGALNECRILKFRIALFAWKIHGYIGNLEDAIFNWILPILDNYEGPEKDDKAIQAFHKLTKLSPSERAAAHYANQAAGAMPRAITYSMYFLDNNLSIMSLCPADYQNRLLSVKNHLDFYNQETCFLQDQFNKTFQRDTDHDAIVNNLGYAFKNLARRAKWIVDAINDLESIS